MANYFPSHLPPDGTPGALTADDSDALARSALFTDCWSQARDKVEQFAFVRHLAHGTFLLQPGEANPYLYVLVEGQLAAFRDTALQQRLARFAPGEFLGEHALIAPEGGSVYVTAQWPSRLVVLEAESLRRVMEDVPRIALNVLDMLGRRLRAANQDRIPAEQNGVMGFMATHDAVTGLYNRRWVSGSYPAEIAHALQVGEPLCLMLMDVDHFEQVNQALGRAGGDAVLRQLADLTRTVFPSQGTVARVAGDRFAALMPGTLPEVLAACESLRLRIVGRQFALRGHIGVRITVSIGVAQTSTDLDAALARASSALARAKERGRNTIEPLA